MVVTPVLASPPPAAQLSSDWDTTTLAAPLAAKPSRPRRLSRVRNAAPVPTPLLERRLHPSGDRPPRKDGDVVGLTELCAEEVVAGEHESAPASLVEEEIDAALNEAVNGLPERCREVFELSRVHGLRYAEIAATLGISIKTVEAQMGKALRILRERLAPWLPGDADAGARGS